MPELDLPAVAGGNVHIGGRDRWQLVVAYRGKHCPICKRYLKGLEELKDEYAAQEVEIVAISGDPLEKAEPDVAEMGLTFPVGYGLTPTQMHELGLYVSHPRSEQETDRDFNEPGLFVVNPEGQLQIVDISNAPFARPDLKGILNGISFIRERGYPIRGTAE